jgi:Ras-related protein Rab-1A
MTQSYYRQAHCIIVIYDVTNQGSFDNVPKWWREIDRYASKQAARIVIGNKSDLTAEVDFEKAQVTEEVPVW